MTLGVAIVKVSEELARDATAIVLSLVAGGGALVVEDTLVLWDNCGELR